MEQGQLNWVANFIWGIADDVLRDLYVRGKYRDVILPYTNADWEKLSIFLNFLVSKLSAPKEGRDEFMVRAACPLNEQPTMMPGRISCSCRILGATRKYRLLLPVASIMDLDNIACVEWNASREDD